MKFNSTKNLLVLTVILLVILIAANYFFFASIRTINLNTSSLSIQIDQYGKQQNETSRDSAAELRTLIDKINSYLLGKDEVVPFIENIEREAKNMGITLLIRSVGTETFGVTNDNTVGDPTKETMRLRVEAVGTWSDDMRFMNYLEHLPYKAQVTNVVFAKMLAGESVSVGGDSGVTGITKKGTAKAPSAGGWRAAIELTVLKQK